jgi:hypothetical protein
MAPSTQILLTSSLIAAAFASLFRATGRLDSNNFQIDPNSVQSPLVSQQTIFLPWKAPFSRSNAYIPSVDGSIFGRSFTFPLQSDSTGIIIGATLLPEVQLTPQNPSGYKYFDYNNVLYSGQYASLDIVLQGTSPGEQAISRVPVLIVTKAVKCLGYNVYTDNGTCPPSKLDNNWMKPLNTVTYMGIGFNQNTPQSGLAYSTPATNPFLNVISLNNQPAASMRTGYILSMQGIHLGLTTNNTQDAAWTSLQKWTGPDPRDWALPLVSFTYDASVPAIQAEALIGLGITQMYIQTTPDRSLPNITVRDPGPPPKPVQIVTPGTKLTFAFPDFENAVGGYDFVVGDTKFPSLPTYVVPIRNESTPFVNTGRNFLFGFSVAYDAVLGRWGLMCERCR